MQRLCPVRERMRHVVERLLDLARLERVQSYRVVKAPFDGVITQRNVDVGALVNAGNTLLFRMAQNATLRNGANWSSDLPAELASAAAQTEESTVQAATPQAGSAPAAQDAPARGRLPGGRR